MPDWSTVFDHAWPVPGATESDLERFVATVGQPLSAVEIRKINARQRNPFPAGDRLHAAWKPFDATAWEVPARPLPPIPDFRQQLDIAVRMLQQGSFPRP